MSCLVCRIELSYCWAMGDNLERRDFGFVALCWQKCFLNSPYSKEPQSLPHSWPRVKSPNTLRLLSCQLGQMNTDLWNDNMFVVTRGSAGRLLWALLPPCGEEWQKVILAQCGRQRSTHWADLHYLLSWVFLFLLGLSNERMTQSHMTTNTFVLALN